VAREGPLPVRLREVDFVGSEAPVAPVDLAVAVEDEPVLAGRCVDPVAVVGP